MNHEVPHPVTATRSPPAGSAPATSTDIPAARTQQSGCEATSESIWLPLPSFAFTLAHLTFRLAHLTFRATYARF
jgi:hypothetical protein